MTTSNAAAIAAWKKRTAREVSLPSGTTVTVELTTVRDEILAGTFTGPVLSLARQFESQTFETGRELPDEELDAFNRFRNVMVARSVVKVEGKPVELTADDAAELPQDDLDELWLYVMRMKKLPKATG